MITKTYKIIKFLTIITTITLSITSCLHTPEQPFREPNSLNNSKQTTKKTASIIFSDLLFDSPIGETTFCSVKFSYNSQNKKLKSITDTIKNLIKKETTIYTASKYNKNPTFTINISTKKINQKKSIKVKLIQNSTKQCVYTKQYPTQTTTKTKP
jgi:hypothetical protein